MASMDIELDGRRYILTGETWVDAESHHIPPEIIRRKLEQKLAQKTQVGRLANFSYIMKRAKQCRETKAYAEALRLAEQALELRPDDPGVYAVICAIHRDRGRPEEALEVTNRLARSNHPALLNSRAAALCDLERWKEAKKVVGRSLAIQKTDEAFSIVRRIKSACPSLYSKQSHK
jgi:tetratricopeptide (TPR) repeat protein